MKHSSFLEKVDPGKSIEEALRRRWEAALEERDALQIQMNNMEKDLEFCLIFLRSPKKLLLGQDSD